MFYRESRVLPLLVRLTSAGYQLGASSEWDLLDLLYCKRAVCCFAGSNHSSMTLLQQS